MEAFAHKKSTLHMNVLHVTIMPKISTGSQKLPRCTNKGRKMSLVISNSKHTIQTTNLLA